MLPAHGIWRETVSLLDVMWQPRSQGFSLQVLTISCLVQMNNVIVGSCQDYNTVTKIAPIFVLGSYHIHKLQKPVDSRAL